MKTNDIIHNFKITQVRKSDELGGTLYEMEHEKTGAQLIWLDNGEENMLFSVSFKTLPWDNTGVFHILEHSVLAGSDRYPVKEPFLDLLKSSMNTFLNAMTFPDKTMYPVSSKNEKDFFNLMRVYLDAVFHPAIYHNESIFRQEGWHYEKDEESGKFYYNGVVFNEMKGVFSSVDSVMEYEILKMLFPDSTYSFESGGDPKAIPDLTYDNFLKAHSEFYSASNAKIYLDGKLPIDKVLEVIDSEYLSDFERENKAHEIHRQQPINSCTAEKYYEIGKDEDEKQKTHIALAKVFADWSERKKIIAYELIASYLAGTNESPLKRAIIEKGLAQDVEFAVESGIYQPFYMIVFRNTEAQNKNEIAEAYSEVIHKILEQGINKDELTACLNQYEFSLREPEEPQGLTRNINAMNSWLYDGDPMLYLESNDLVKQLRRDIDGTYFSEILEELADETATALLTMLPSKTKGDEDRALEQKRADEESGSWSDDERKKALETTENMRKWQDTPDSPEDIATLPVLSLSDVNPAPSKTDTLCERADGAEILFHPVDCNGVLHCNLYFSIADCSDAQIAKLSVMSELLGVLPTKKYTSAQLQHIIKKNFGTLGFTVAAASVKNKPEICKAYFHVYFSILESNVGNAVDIVREILCETDYSKNSIIRETLLQSGEMLYQSIMSSGHLFSLRRTLSKTSASAYVDEKAQGYDIFRFVKNINDHFEDEIDTLKADMKRLADKIFVSSRLIMSHTAKAKNEQLAQIISKLPTGEKSAKEYFEKQPEEQQVLEAILIPSGVSYASSGANLAKYNAEYDGRLTVIANLLTYGYLWNEIRVHAGAYGCGFRAGTNSNAVFHSYRDPNPLNSVAVYKNTSEFIKAFVSSDESIERYIISSIASTDRLMSCAKRGQLADFDYFSGITYEDRLNANKQMLSMEKEDLLSYCDLFDAMAKGNSVCIIGSSEKLSDLDGWDIYKL